MARVILPALLFAACAIAAAQWGWAEPPLPAETDGARTPSPPLPSAEPQLFAAAAVPADAGSDHLGAEAPRPVADLAVTFVREEPGLQADAAPRTLSLPPFHLTATCGRRRFTAMTDPEWEFRGSLGGVQRGVGHALLQALPVGRCAVTFGQAGWTVDTLEVAVGELEEVSLTEAPEAVLAVEVVDALGRPVPASLVVSSPWAGYSVSDVARLRLPSAVQPPADGDEHLEAHLQIPPSGQLEFSGLRGGGFYGLSASADGFVETTQQVQVLVDRRAAARLVLERAASLLVTVGGLPPDGASPVSVIYSSSAVGSTGFGSERVGPLFRLSGLPPGGGELLVAVGNDPVLWRSVAALAPGEQRELSLRLDLVAIDVQTDTDLMVQLICGATQTSFFSASLTPADGHARFRVPAALFPCRATQAEHDEAEVVAPGAVRLKRVERKTRPSGPLLEKRRLHPVGDQGY